MKLIYIYFDYLKKIFLQAIGHLMKNLGRVHQQNIQMTIMMIITVGTFIEVNILSISVHKISGII